MERISKLTFGLALLVFVSLTSASPVFAGAVQLTSAAQLNPADVTVAYPTSGTPISPTAFSLPNPLALSGGGNTLTFSKPTGLFVISAIFPGQLSTGNAFGQGGSPITIDFANGVTEVGFDATPNFRLPGFQFTFTAFNGVTALGTFNVATPLPGPTSVFLGVRATDGDLITRIVVNHTIGDFAIGAVTFGPAGAPVPEPTTLLLFFSGLAGVGALRRRSRRN